MKDTVRELYKRLEQAEARCGELHNAIVWALGAGEIFRPQGTMDGKYWWRGELAERARLTWDGDKYVALSPTVENGDKG